MSKAKCDTTTRKLQQSGHIFCYNMRGQGGTEINPFVLEVRADDLGHALQKIAAQLSDKCTEVAIWKRKRYHDFFRRLKKS